MTGTTFHARPASAGRYTLAEGPVWDPVRRRLLWVDIVGGTVHEGLLDAADTVTETGSWRFDATVGAVAVAADGTLLVAERHTLIRVDPDGHRSEVARVLPADRASRLNDGAVDPAGRFLVGSLAQDARWGEEVLVRLDGGTVTVLDDRVVLSNGLAWSPTGDRMYHADTLPGIVYVHDYDPGTGATGPRRELCVLTDGMPDGLCVDVDGNLWIAVWNGARVECRDPDGALLATVPVDAPHTSSVAFAGPDLDVLVITTATDDLEPAELLAYPDSGRLFTARVGTRGLPVPYWAP